MNFPLLHFVPTAGFPSTEHHQEESGFTFLPHQVFIHTDKSSLSHLFSRLNCSSSQSLLTCCHSTWINFTALFWTPSSMWLWYWGAQNSHLRTQCSDRSHHGQAEGRIPFLNLLPSLFWILSRMSLTFFIISIHFCLLFSQVSTRTSESFLPSCFSGRRQLSLNWFSPP